LTLSDASAAVPVATTIATTFTTGAASETAVVAAAARSATSVRLRAIRPTAAIGAASRRLRRHRDDIRTTATPFAAAAIASVAASIGIGPPAAAVYAARRDRGLLRGRCARRSLWLRLALHLRRRLILTYAAVASVA